MRYTCKICGHTMRKKDDLRFFWFNQNIWCEKHVPESVLRYLGWIK